MARSTPRVASTKSSREDTVEISGTKTAEDASDALKIKNDISLPDAVIENIREMARKDAQKDIYTDDEYIAYRYAYKNQHIFPDCSKLLMGLKGIFFNLPRVVNRYQTFSLMGVQVDVDFYSAFSTFYNSNGEKIMTCDADGDVMEFPTEAERRYYKETTAIYAEAYDAARAEMKAGGQGQTPPGTDTSQVDVRA